MNFPSLNISKEFFELTDICTRLCQIIICPIAAILVASKNLGSDNNPAHLPDLIPSSCSFGFILFDRLYFNEEGIMPDACAPHPLLSYPAIFAFVL
jgi:hypothetical protein